MNQENNIVKPISKEDRIVYLDILRGIAILFIFTANIPFFSGIFFFPEEFRFGWANLAFDKSLDFIMYALIDGKFYSIFSLLFGIGCVIQFQNLTYHNKPFPPFFRKRMFWLLAIGCIHLFLLWPGDILTLYAVLGFILIWFIKMENRTLLSLAALLIFFPIVNWVFMEETGIHYPGIAFDQSLVIFHHFGMPTMEWNGREVTNFPAYLQNPNLIDHFKMSLGKGFVRIGRILDEGREFKVFGVFLIGLWTGRKILNEDLLNNKSFLKKVLIWGLIIGLPFNFLRANLEFYGNGNKEQEFLKILYYALGTVPLAMAYAAGIALWVKKGTGVLKWFQPVGKMALTNYLSQTIISIIIFYGIGFGLAGKLGFTVIMIIAFTIFFLQMIFSKVWLSYFKYGPMEWLWRKLTYGISLKFKR
ncbi:DUF418 domain-containing protein [Mangrovimonas sp. ST2L15]|uniref:DUF418 domain-containing protein n=1 Tax=Mangrovimonas sp. ST2L15 TaxID=1645916 RepID=UPI0006B5A6D4|nr:DUF418 domain-containing protein [Mangrovimonas sp. ST2L15]